MTAGRPARRPRLRRRRPAAAAACRPRPGRLLSIALRGDAESVVDGLREEGFIKSSIEIDGDALLAYLAPFLEPC